MSNETILLNSVRPTYLQSWVNDGTKQFRRRCQFYLGNVMEAPLCNYTDKLAAVTYVVDGSRRALDLG